MTDEQFKQLMDKLEEIRCCTIDVEEAALKESEPIYADVSPLRFIDVDQLRAEFEKLFPGNPLISPVMALFDDAVRRVIEQ